MARVIHTIGVNNFLGFAHKLTEKGDPRQKDTKDQDRIPEMGTEMKVSRGSEERLCFMEILGHLL